MGGGSFRADTEDMQKVVDALKQCNDDLDKHVRRLMPQLYIEDGAFTDTTEGRNARESYIDVKNKMSHFLDSVSVRFVKLVEDLQEVINAYQGSDNASSTQLASIRLSQDHSQAGVSS